MPPKTVKCDICGEEVLKRQTLAITDGKRACRSHEETEDKAADQQNKIKKRLKVLENKYKKRFRSPDGIDSADPIKFTPKCFRCYKPGVRQQEFFLNILIAWQKYEITYGKRLNIFDPEENMKAYSELMGSRCLWFVKYDPEKIKLNYNQRMAAQITGIVLLCQPCCEATGIDPRPAASDDMTSEELLRVGTILGVLMKPVIKEEAERQIRERN